MPRLPFSSALLLAPLAYAIHHAEEHLVFNFRAWRLKYFPDTNALSTEAVLVILTAVGLVYVLLHATIRTRVSAWVALLFLMATQVHNAFFHIGGTLVFSDFSPGLITAIALYLPVNALIVRVALAEGLVTPRQLGALFVGGGALFWAFEYAGPAILLAAVPVTWVWALASGRRGVHDKGVTHA
jgi:hypothetical protein